MGKWSHQLNGVPEETKSFAFPASPVFAIRSGNFLIYEQTVTENEIVYVIFVIWNLRNNQLTLNNCSDLILCLFWLVLFMPWCEMSLRKVLPRLFFCFVKFFSFKLRRHKDTLFASDSHCFSWWMEINNSFAVRDFLYPLGPYSSFPLKKTCQVARIFISFLK